MRPKYCEDCRRFRRDGQLCRACNSGVPTHEARSEFGRCGPDARLFRRRWFIALDWLREIRAHREIQRQRAAEADAYWAAKLREFQQGTERIKE
jgi:hypothetical protein